MLTRGNVATNDIRRFEACMTLSIIQQPWTVVSVMFATQGSLYKCMSLKSELLSA